MCSKEEEVMKCLTLFILKITIRGDYLMLFHESMHRNYGCQVSTDCFVLVVSFINSMLKDEYPTTLL